MAEKTATKGGKTNRKFNRNRKDCERYRREGRYEKNRARRLRRHLKKHPNDLTAASAIERARDKFGVL